MPTDTRYIPLTQQRWCCVPTCFQMVMLRHKMPLVPAEVIGWHMGLTVPKADRSLFWNARTGKRPPAGYGTRANERKFSANAVLRKLKIPLQVGGPLIDNFDNLEQFKDYLGRIEKEDKDVLVCFDWGKLTGERYHGGHVCVFDRYYPKQEEVRIIDPAYHSPKWRTVKTKRLFDAMKYHGADKSGGFWEIINNIV